MNSHFSPNGDTEYVIRKVRRFLMLGKPLGRGWSFDGTTSGQGKVTINFSRAVKNKQDSHLRKHLVLYDNEIIGSPEPLLEVPTKDYLKLRVQLWKWHLHRTRGNPILMLRRKRILTK